MRPEGAGNSWHVLFADRFIVIIVCTCTAGDGRKGSLSVKKSFAGNENGKSIYAELSKRSCTVNKPLETSTSRRVNRPGTHNARPPVLLPVSAVELYFLNFFPQENRKPTNRFLPRRTFFFKITTQNCFTHDAHTRVLLFRFFIFERDSITLLELQKPENSKKSKRFTRRVSNINRVEIQNIH